jgi:hypothetical protein
MAYTNLEIEQVKSDLDAQNVHKRIASKQRI